LLGFSFLASLRERQISTIYLPNSVSMCAVCSRAVRMAPPTQRAENGRW
jgi:hypothetical protein